MMLPRAKRFPGNPGRPLLQEEQLRALQHLTRHAASRELGVSHKTLGSYARKYGVDFAKPVPVFPKRPSAEEWAEACATHTRNDLARRFNVKLTTIALWQRQLGATPLPGKSAQVDRIEGYGQCKLALDWMKRAIGDPFGGAGWHSVGRLEMVRGME